MQMNVFAWICSLCTAFAWICTAFAHLIIGCAIRYPKTGDLCYMAAIVSRLGLSIDAHCRNQPNKSRDFISC